MADTKSPTDWTCGSCVYLSVQDQKCLSYGIVEVIPYRAYTRKNIGYLWAIQQGATKVFDTDGNGPIEVAQDEGFSLLTLSIFSKEARRLTNGSIWWI